MSKKEIEEPYSETERLLRNSTAADVWAAEFVKLHGGDEELMLAWFANAIEVGRTAGKSARKRASGEIPITVGIIPDIREGLLNAANVPIWARTT